jgi:hypothetical protein
LFLTGGYFSPDGIAGMDRLCHLHLYRLTGAVVDAARRSPAPSVQTVGLANGVGVIALLPKMLNSPFHFILKGLSKVAKL